MVYVFLAFNFGKECICYKSMDIMSFAYAVNHKNDSQISIRFIQHWLKYFPLIQRFP